MSSSKSNECKTKANVILDNDGYNKICISIVQISKLTPDTKLVEFICNGPLTFFAGQFVCLYATADCSVTTNSESELFPGTFSVVSAPFTLPHFQIAIDDNANPRSMKNYLYNKACVGQELYVSAKGYGTVAVTPEMFISPLPWNGGRGKLVLIGGGWGLPALLSITHELLHSNEGKLIPQITLMHSVRNASHIPWYDNLLELEKKHSNFKVIHTVTNPQWGRPRMERKKRSH
jgi:ferredoxin-NADP reductase